MSAIPWFSSQNTHIAGEMLENTETRARERGFEPL
jgi:hypothetical protein